MPRIKRRVRKGIIRKDLLLKKIYDYKELSPEAVYAIEGDFYTEKLIEKLQKEGLIKKSNLKNSKKTVKNVGITAKVHRYYVTAKGQKYLREKFPDKYKEELLVVNNLSNNAVERGVKTSDTKVMAEVAGAYIVNDNGENIDPVIVKENISRGMFLPASVAKSKLSLSADDVHHFRFTALTGILLTSQTPYFLYHAGNGFLTQTAEGEHKVATALQRTFILDYGLRYSDTAMGSDNINAIIFCKGLDAFAKLVTNRYNRKTPPGEIFDKAYVIPISRHGCNIVRRLTLQPDYKNKLIAVLYSEYGYTRSIGRICNCMPLLDQAGIPVYIGIDFEMNYLRMAKRIINDGNSEYKKMAVLCYDWQQPYYKELIEQLGTNKISLQPVNEDTLDEVIGFQNKIPVGNSRKRSLTA